MCKQNRLLLKRDSIDTEAKGDKRKKDFNLATSTKKWRFQSFSCLSVFKARPVAVLGFKRSAEDNG